MVKDTTLYNRLEIEPNASSDEIRKAYNKLSKKYHPDKQVNATDDIKKQAHVKFQEITQAKDILSDPQKKNLYDQIGMDIFTNGMDNDQHHGQSPFGDFGHMFNQGFPFGGMGGMPGMGGMGGQRRQQVEDIVTTIEVSLEQVYTEEVINYSYNQKIDCGICNGEGTKNGQKTTCRVCDGQGMRVVDVRMGPMVQRSMSECNACKGSGKIIEEGNKCPGCSGECIHVKNKTIQIPLKAGLTSGNKINFSGKGHHVKNMKSNLIIIIHIKPHNVFKRSNDNLFININLELYQALFGFNKLITHLDSRKLLISCSNKTEYNTVRKISCEGMKSIQTGVKGDLYIRFTISLPNLSLLSNEVKSELKTILQSPYTTEIANEEQLKTVDNTVKTTINDCSSDISNQVIELLCKNSNSAEQEEYNHAQQQDQRHAQCAQQ
jgi:DnaJ family protein A protein 2